MRILYDHQMFSIQKYGGVTKYFCELMKSFPFEHEYTLSLLLSDNQYLKENNKIFKKKNFPLPNSNFKGKRFFKKSIYNLNQIYSSHFISSNEFDVFHPTFYDNYFFSVLKKPYVITVHDLIAFRYKDTYLKEDPYRHLMKRVIKNATRIISVSQNTKQDIIDTFNINEENIDVVYHGFAKPKMIERTLDYGKYILFVGRRSGYKNFKRFVNSISNLLNKEGDIKLVCVGEPFNRDENSELIKLKIFKQAIALTVDEDSLNNLYANALLFVYPSFYEGFGMPILEAFANNCPVCLSNTSCFPEIAGNAGIYFDPNDQESISTAVNKVIYTKIFRNQMINRGIERLSEFSWSKTAKKTLLSYQKAVC